MSKDIEKSEDENVSTNEPEITSSSSLDSCETMDAPPSASRQPPDGHEFPDYHETPITPKPIKMEDSSNKHSSPWLNNSLWKTNTSSLLFRDQQSSCSVRDKIAIFSNASKLPNDLINAKKISESADDILGAIEKEPFTKNKVVLRDNKVKRSVSALCKTEINSISNEERASRKQHHNSSMSVSKARSTLDLTSTLIGTSFLSEEKIDKPLQTNSMLPRLHIRSQSLMDISSADAESTPKKDRWNLLAEQRQRSLSKLKGLIIPERVVEVDLPNVVDLPEIKSNDPPTPVINSTVLPATTLETPIVPCQRNISVPSLSVPPWSNPNSNNIPKYSPAFKRKSLQLHSSDSSSKTDIANENASSSIVAESQMPTKLNQKQLAIRSITQTNIYDNQDVKISGNLCLVDAPKSLESITSPTRSDCSFEYNSPPDTRSCRQEQVQKVNQLDAKIGLGIIHKTKEDLGKSEDESDNDSAVSSSQSSYISRTSPPTSPSHLHSNFSSRSCNGNDSDSLTQLKCHSTGSQSCDNQNHRLLKAQSVEAINRKNILASAKCRSGRDLKIGSPLIQRKFEEEFVSDNIAALQVNNSDLEYNSSKYYKDCATIHEKVNDVPNISESNKAQGEITSKEEDDLLVDNKPDLTNDCGMQPWTRNESKHITGQARSNVNENCFKASVSTTIVTNTEITTSHKDIKTENKSIGREVSSLINGQERKTAITRPLTREVRSTSVTDLRKSFEKLTPLSPTIDLSNTNLNKRNSLSATKNNQPAKCTSPPSSQPPVKSNLIQEKLSSSKGSTSKDIEIIVLRPEIPGGSVGITLAGGADYENKEITVHKIREDSSAHRDGRLQKGDSVVSINGKSVHGLTHKELVALLKEPLPEVTLAISKQQKKPLEVVAVRKSSISAEDLVPTKQKENTTNSTNQQKIFVVSLVKDAAGLGLSLEGGKDSPMGNKPLLIKKIFKGGAAEKCGNLHMGDELLLVNETDVTTMSRFEAWSVLKKLPEEITISLTVKR